MRMKALPETLMTLCPIQRKSKQIWLLVMRLKFYRYITSRQDIDSAATRKHKAHRISVSIDTKHRSFVGNTSKPQEMEQILNQRYKNILINKIKLIK